MSIYQLYFHHSAAFYVVLCVNLIVSSDSAAALRVLSHLPLPYSAFSALCVIPSPLRDGVYNYVAKRRYEWFGKADDYLVLQEKELLERFIDREELMSRDKDS